MAKSFGNVFKKIVSFDNLATALRLASRGKRDRSEVRSFIENKDIELSLLQNHLITGEYRPHGYTQFKIMDPKPRVITCAAFRDRVVHHAICCVV